jgi:protein-tyrosine-phosphatase
MTEGLAKRKWPEWQIKSVGTDVSEEASGPADEAITVMNSRGIDIRNHKATKIESVDVNSYQFVLALDKEVKRKLVSRYGVDSAKIIDFFVRDPYAGGLGPYIKCANEISQKLAAMSFGDGK